MLLIAAEVEKRWCSRLLEDYPQQSQQTRASIVRWLIGEEQTCFEGFESEQLMTVKRGIEYRYYILQERYLEVSSTQAYRNLINQLGLLVLPKQIRSQASLSRERQRTIVDTLHQLLREMLSDRTIQKQMDWIAQCTQDGSLRESLLLASVEEYCSCPFGNRPLIAYRFTDYLRRQRDPAVKRRGFL